MEMAAGESHWLVPTFEGAPDRWGTKPPLLVWSQAVGIRLFGPNELAIRLPAALAALATIGLLIGFSYREWGRAGPGLAASLVLLTTDLYIESHGARAGDFDTLLALWLTGGVLSFYRFLQEKELRPLYIAAACLLLAGWTKGISAFFFLPAMALYCILLPQHRWVWRLKQLYLSVGLAVAGILSYYFLRELYDPGYLQAVWGNELGGRYLSSQEGHQWGAIFYLRMFWKYPLFHPWLLWLPLAVLLCWRTDKDRRLSAYLLSLSLFLLAILSGSATKLLWYCLPMLPLLALLIGRGFWLAGESVRPYLPAGRSWTYLLIFAFSLPVFAPAYATIIRKVAAEEHSGPYATITVYRNFITVAESEQYELLLPSYNPHAVFYQKRANQQGKQLSISYLQPPPLQVDASVDSARHYQAGTQVAVCEMTTWQYMADRYEFEELEVLPPCKLLSVRSSK